MDRPAWQRMLRASLFALPFLALAAGFTVWGGIGYMLPYSQVSVPASASPSYAGKLHGELLGPKIKRLEGAYLNLSVCGGDKLKMKAVASAAASLFKRLDPRWLEELKGVETGSGVPAETLLFGNSFLDFGNALAACRTAVVKTSDGRLLHARNLDWSLGSEGKGALVFFENEASKDGISTLRLAFPGMLGALDIVNSKGLALSFNQLGRGLHAPEALVFIYMREIGETCDSFSSARAKLLAMPPGMPFCITLSDAKTGDAAVYERLRDGVEIKERLPVDGILVADNSPWAGRESLMPERCGILKAAREIAPDDAESLKRLMAGKRVLLSCNMYSFVLDFKRSELHFACGESPAAKGQWQTRPLFAAR